MTVHFASLEHLRARTSVKWRAYPDDVLPAFVAELDVELAPAIATRLHAAIDASDTGYRWLSGLPEALASFADDAWGWTFSPGDVTVLPDVITALHQAIDVLTRPGAGIVINSPVYPPFWSTITGAGRTVVDVPMARTTTGSWELDLAGIEAAFARPDVTAFVLCSPHNPTGTVPSAGELHAIAAAAAAHGVAVIADEIHAPLAYPGVAHTPYLKVAGPDAAAVSLLSASKGWNLAGLKCAQLVASGERLSRTFRTQVPLEVSYATGHLGVLASITAYTDAREWREELQALLAANAGHLGRRLAERLPGVGFAPPRASYLAWLDCTALGPDADPAAFFLRQARVALSEGPTFGPSGAGFARLNFGTSTEIIDELVDRLARAWEEQR